MRKPDLAKIAAESGFFAFLQQILLFPAETDCNFHQSYCFVFATAEPIAAPHKTSVKKRFPLTIRKAAVVVAMAVLFVSSYFQQKSK